MPPRENRGWTRQPSVFSLREEKGRGRGQSVGAGIPLPVTTLLTGSRQWSGVMAGRPLRGSPGKISLVKWQVLLRRGQLEKTKALTLRLTHLRTCRVMALGLFIRVAFVLFCIRFILVYRPGSTLSRLCCLLRRVITWCRFLELVPDNVPRVVVTALLLKQWTRLPVVL